MRFFSFDGHSFARWFFVANFFSFEKTPWQGSALGALRRGQTIYTFEPARCEVRDDELELAS